MKRVAVILGSDSDLPVLEGAFQTLRSLEVPFEAHAFSAHRTPHEAAAFAKSARENGFGVLIAAAGMAAHLAGALAARTTLPVIGVPIAGRRFDGMDALLSTVMMPTGVPVATVAINGADNAAILAIEIMALSDDSLASRMQDLKTGMAAKTQKNDSTIKQRREEIL